MSYDWSALLYVKLPQLKRPGAGGDTFYVREEQGGNTSSDTKLHPTET